MNEKAINQVISNYAIENANLKVAVATLSIELEDLRSKQNTEDEGEK